MKEIYIVYMRGAPNYEVRHFGEFDDFFDALLEMSRLKKIGSAEEVTIEWKKVSH